MAYDIAMKMFIVSCDLLDGFIDFDEYERKHVENWSLAMQHGVVPQVKEILARFAKNDFSK